jgi:hypothetical protein
LDVRVLLNRTELYVARVVDDDVNAAVQRDRLVRDRFEIGQRGGHVELKDVRALLLECIKRAERARARRGDHFIATVKGGERQFTSNARPGCGESAPDTAHINTDKRTKCQ